MNLFSVLRNDLAYRKGLPTTFPFELNNKIVCCDTRCQQVLIELLKCQYHLSLVKKDFS